MYSSYDSVRREALSKIPIEFKVKMEVATLIGACLSETCMKNCTRERFLC
jgi:hypothetical protein